MSQINFGEIDRIALFGGSWLSAALCRSLTKRDLTVMLFSSRRHLEDIVEKDGSILSQVAYDLGIPTCSTEDINTEPSLPNFITPSTLGLAAGATWVFNKETVALFASKLLDFMGIMLPQYRGGAHYTWQILRRNKQGCCNLQVIHGGHETFHKGEIIKRCEYFFPASVRIPQDYFDAAIPQEVAFLEEFFDEVAVKKDFTLQPLQESASAYFPFLSTLKQGFIDWHWNTDEIERFICAFDDPYPGASTFISGKQVFLKDCHAVYSDGPTHPFQSGLVYRVTDNALYVATRDGALVVRRLLDKQGQFVLKDVLLGQRFFTSQSKLEEAMQFEAAYDAKGLRLKA